MSSGRGDLESTTRSLLAAHVGEIRHRRRVERILHQWLERGSVDLAAKVGDDLREMPYGDGLDSSESDFRRRLGGAENSVEPGSPRSLRDRKRTGDRAYATVERELADRRVGGEPLGRKLPRCRKDGERDGKVEAGSLLAERRRCEIDRDPAVQRPFE